MTTGIKSLYHADMPSPRPLFANGEFYHVFNRGVEKRIIFNSSADYTRFVTAIRLFNTTRPVTLRDFFQPTGIKSLFTEGEKLVQICSFILMPNHFHFLLRQLRDNGISLFMQKMGAGYAGYFNLKYSRVGGLFQGTYKARHIADDRYARYIQAYIPLNALDRAMPKWREGIPDVTRAKRIVQNHPWSSISSYTKKNRFPGIIDPLFLKEFFTNTKEFENFVFSWTDDAYEEMHDIVAG